ncbi:hypothetical protein CDD83_2716 [Cordyceps sp. RAO-2017]|nr:hypothetical protein CDD83_2716 [Cordyceps sp. RAO-2017]
MLELMFSDKEKPKALHGGFFSALADGALDITGINPLAIALVPVFLFFTLFNAALGLFVIPKSVGESGVKNGVSLGGDVLKGIGKLFKPKNKGSKRRGLETTPVNFF